MQGPFDPDAATQALETTRSSAFDAPVKPVVAPMEASKISKIGQGLATSRTRRLAPEVLVPKLADEPCGLPMMR